MAHKRVSDCFDDAGNIIKDCMDRLQQEDRDFDNMKNQTTKPTTSLNGHSDDEYERGVNPTGANPNNMPFANRDQLENYYHWKYRDDRARQGLFREGKKSWKTAKVYQFHLNSLPYSSCTDSSK